MTSVKHSKKDNNNGLIYKKRETLMNHINKRQPLNNMFHKLGQVLTNAADFKSLTCSNIHLTGNRSLTLQHRKTLYKISIEMANLIKQKY